ncbi:MAG: sulfatase-like hydrolase/transferase [Planctomycetes bacterium]|nr:sulfatase-like hydrolase/transferase [Planctomycetota bacterium]
MPRALIPLVLILVTVLPVVALPAQHANILVIVADDLGVDYVGVYGEGTNPPPTPHLDALAQGGVLFRNAWANPSCSPTRACIQTGRYPFRTLVGRWIGHTQSPQNVGLLQAAERTLPERLDAAGSGYAHALIGKWHLHDAFQPIDVPRSIGGYSHYAGSLEGQIPSYFQWTRVVDGVAAPSTTYCTIQNTDDALAWIQARSTPWLCVLTYQAPHIPYHAPPAHLHTQNLTGLTPQPTTHTPANIPFYRAMVESLDSEIGRLFTTLGPAVMASTNVIFLGDNGSVQRQSVAPFDGTRSKGTPYEGGVNVPLIVAGPAVQQPGREVAALACAVDVFATVLELAGANGAIAPFEDVDGVSLVPYLTDPNQTPLRQYAFTEQFTGTAWPAPNGNGHATIRDARYKLIHRWTGADELFDLQADPWEQSNLIASANPAVVAAKNALLAEITRLRSGGGGASNLVVFGDSTCPGWNGPPLISATGNPALGGVVDVHLTNGGRYFYGGSAFCLLGFSWTQFGAFTLPVGLQQFGGPTDCRIATSPEFATWVATDFLGGATFALAIPTSPAFVGVELFAAWLSLDPGANALGAVPTNSVMIRVE